MKNASMYKASPAICKWLGRCICIYVLCGVHVLCFYLEVSFVEFALSFSCKLVGGDEMLGSTITISIVFFD